MDTDTLIKCVPLTEILNSDYKKEYLVEGLIVANSITLLTGNPKVGKSLITQFLASSISQGTPFLDRFKTKKSRIAFLDKENEDFALKERYKNMNLHSENIIYFQTIARFGKKIMEELYNKIHIHEIDVLIVDSLVRFNSGDENSSKDISYFIDFLRHFLRNTRINTIILVHHHRKQGIQRDSSQDAIRGSTDILAGVDVHLSVSKEARNDRLTLKSNANRFGDDFSKVLFKLISNSEEFRLEYLGTEDEEIKIDKDQKTEQILLDQIRKNKNVSQQDLFKVVHKKGGYGETKTRKILKRLVTNNKILLTKQGKQYYYSTTTS